MRKNSFFAKIYNSVLLNRLGFIIFGLMVLTFALISGQNSESVSAHSGMVAPNCYGACRSTPVPVNCHYWSSIGRGDCGACGLLESHFGTRVWAAREICSMEATWAGEPCSNEASGAIGEIGCFQIGTIHCGNPVPYTCPTWCGGDGHSVNLSTDCINKLKDSHNNIIVACALSSCGTNWPVGTFGAAATCEIPSPPSAQWRNPQ